MLLSYSCNADLVADIWVRDDCCDWTSGSWDGSQRVNLCLGSLR